jgi:hypothetical protein
MTTLDRVRALFAEGDVVRCIENTYRPALDGTDRRIDKMGKSYAECTSLTGPDVGKRGFYMRLPERARDVVELTDTRVTYRIRGEHTVTLEVLR